MPIQSETQGRRTHMPHISLAVVLLLSCRFAKFLRMKKVGVPLSSVKYVPLLPAFLPAPFRGQTQLQSTPCHTYRQGMMRDGMSKADMVGFLKAFAPQSDWVRLGIAGMKHTHTCGGGWKRTQSPHCYCCYCCCC